MCIKQQVSSDLTTLTWLQDSTANRSRLHAKANLISTRAHRWRWQCANPRSIWCKKLCKYKRSPWISGCYEHRLSYWPCVPFFICISLLRFGAQSWRSSTLYYSNQSSPLIRADAISTDFCASPAGNIYNHAVQLVAYLDHDPIHPQLWCAVHQPLQVYVQIVKDQVQLLWLIQNLHQPVEARQTQMSAYMSWDADAKLAFYSSHSFVVMS